MFSHSFPISRRSRQGGQMSIEYAIVIGLIALVLAGIVFYVALGRNRTKVNNAVSGLTSMVGGIQKLYSTSQTGYASVTVPVLINNGVVPTKMVQDNTSIFSQFGTPVDVAPANLYGTNDGVAITYESVPHDMCSGFVQGVQGWFAQISVGGTMVKNIVGGGSVALDPTTLGTACDASQAGSGVDIIFTAGR